MPELLIMRHAKSAWHTGEPDFDRPLAPRGERAADRMAQWLLDQDLCPDRILSSAAQRTRATALVLMWTCGVDRSAVDFSRDLYLAGVGHWLRAIRQQTCERLLICRHNPGLDDLVLILSSSMPPLSHSGKLMTTAAIAHLRFPPPWRDVAAGTGELLALGRPRELP